MATEVKTIRVVLDAKGDARQVLTGLQSIKQSIQDVGKEVNSFAKFRDIFASIFAFNVLGMGISGLANIADSLSMVRERLKAFNGDAELTESIMLKLQKTARDVRQPIDNISESYARIAIATKKYKLDADAQIAINQMLAQTFKLSNSSPEEAAGGMIQLTQAMSRGVLRGQELISVMSNNSTLAAILSDEAQKLGKNIYEMGEKGQITMKFFFNVLAKRFNEVNDAAKNTKGTFQQGVTLAMNEFKTSVDKVNKALDLSNNFYKFISFLVDNKDVILSAIVAIGTALAVSLAAPITAAIAKLATLATAINPLVLAAAAIAGAFTYLILNLEKVRTYLDRFVIAVDMAFMKVGISITNARIALTDFLKLNSSGLKAYRDSQEAALAKVGEKYDAVVKKYEDMNKAQDESVDGADKIKKAAKSILDAMVPLNEQVAALNLAYNRGAIDVETYNSKLLDLQRRMLEDEVFVKATKSMEDMDKAMSTNTLEAYARSFERGAISLETFNKKVNDFKIEELNRKFLSGKISVDDYRISLAELSKDLGIVDGAILGFQVGLIKTNKTMGDWISGVSSVTESAFGSFEDAIFNASKNATDAWANMTQAILDDITRLVIRMAIVKPLVNAFMGVDWGGPQEVGSTASTSGGVGQRMQAFASGGIVSSPTYFGSASKMGVMGEAGPEAIMPLTKMSDGSLGVSAAASNTIVNIINQSGSEVSQTESTGANGEKIIDVLIMSKVREGISSGMFDKAFSQNYGLRRRGV